MLRVAKRILGTIDSSRSLSEAPSASEEEELLGTDLSNVELGAKVSLAFTPGGPLVYQWRADDYIED